MLLLLSIFAKIIYFTSRFSGRGSGTSLPGWIVEKYFPNLLKDLAQNFEEIILISGTNGKTTTRAVLSQIYESNHKKVCTNRGGANILRGIASSLLLNLDWLGRNNSEVLILEVEEASLPKLTQKVKPDKIIFTNLFRDQLDVYGEIDQTFNYFKQTLLNLGVKTKQNPQPEQDNILAKPLTFANLQKKINSRKNFHTDLKVYINYDDKKLLKLIDTLDFYVVGYSLELDPIDLPKYEGQAPVFSLPQKIYQASNIISKNLESSFTVKIDKKNEFLIETKLPGTFNIYNILPAFLVGYEKFGKNSIPPIVGFKPVFGRGEKITLPNQKQLTLFLVKNPAGFDEVLKLVSSNFPDKKLNFGFLINDKIADGKDVSWLWDVNFEKHLKSIQINKIFTSGSRGLDILLRLQHAEYLVKLTDFVDEMENLLNLIEIENQDFIVFSTYTVMLEFRKNLEQKVNLAGINSSGF